LVKTLRTRGEFLEFFRKEVKDEVVCKVSRVYNAGVCGHSKSVGFIRLPLDFPFSSLCIYFSILLVLEPGEGEELTLFDSIK